VKTLAVAPHSAAAVVVEAVNSAVVEKAAGVVVTLSSVVAAFVANLQQPLLAAFVVVASSDAVPLTVVVVGLQLPHSAGLKPVTCFVHDAAVAVTLVLQICSVTAAD
jgi:hypothetical protein